ncbi:hypothetical protein ACI2JA_19230 [Alkalihalobacillus sp. NPDC078783]
MNRKDKLAASHTVSAQYDQLAFATQFLFQTQRNRVTYNLNGAIYSYF